MPRMGIESDMVIDAFVPIKAGSQRLHLKNFQILHGKISLWEDTFRFLYRAKNQGILRNIFLSVDDRQAIKTIEKQLKNYDYCPIILLEKELYEQGKTLGQTIANFMKYIDGSIKSGNNQPMDYLLVPQCDIIPKHDIDIVNLRNIAWAHPNADYIISMDKTMNQVGMWRLIKHPLNQEVLGQTIKGYFLDRLYIDIHYKEDLEKAKQLLRNSNVGEI